MLSRARAAEAWDTFTCTGEGGFPEPLRRYDDHMITQVATGLFGYGKKPSSGYVWWSLNMPRVPNLDWEDIFWVIK
jgi:glutamate synthase domain-containing protein 2